MFEHIPKLFFFLVWENETKVHREGEDVRFTKASIWKGKFLKAKVKPQLASVTLA